MVEALHMVMDVSVTEANLNNASFQWGCNLATHCSVFVRLSLRKTISSMELRAASSQWLRQKGLGAGPWRAPTILNWRRMMAKQSSFSPANRVLLQVLKMIWHTTKNLKRFELYFDATSYSKGTDNSIVHKLADINSMLKVFLLITELLMSSILISFFSCSVENLSKFTLPWHYARALHITRYNYLCEFFIHVCRLDTCQCTWQ